MPTITPVAPSAPYDTVEYVLNLTRARLNDAGYQLAGDTLKDTNPLTQVWFNAAWRSLQEYLADLEYSVTQKEVVLSFLPQVGSTDPASKYWISWTQLFNGADFYEESTNLLPPDLMLPIKLWERRSGSQGTWGEPMTLWMDGLPGQKKQMRNHIWEWRDEAIWMPGAQESIDLRIRYQAYKPDIIAIGNTPWYAQQIPLMRCTNALSYFMAHEVSSSRGDTDTATLLGKGQAAAKQMLNRDVTARQRTNIRRQARSRHSGHGVYPAY